jgi:hypothetical protein
MRACRVFGLLWLVFSLGACASSEVRTMTVYKGLVVDREVVSFEGAYEDTLVIDEEGGVIKYDGGRVTFPLSDCGDATWFCLSDGHIEFAVERDWSGATESWTYRSMSYTVIRQLRSASVEGFGEAFYIRAVPAGELHGRVQPKVFLYSPSEGMLAISMHLSGEGGSLIPVTYIRVN